MILLCTFCETFKKDIEKSRAGIKWIINSRQNPNTREIETDIRQFKNKASLLLYCYLRKAPQFLNTDDVKEMWNLEKNVASPTSQS